MKEYIKIICLIVLSCIKVNSFSQSNFTTYNNATNIVQAKYKLYESDTIPLLGNKNPISGYSISGNVELKNKASLVRVILVDRNGEEYLVYEAYPLISGLGVSHFSNTCEETSLLNNVSPSYLKVIVEDAVLQIDTIQASDIAIRTEKYRAVKQDLSLNQANEKARKINEYHAKHGGTWFAGVTNMALLPYKSKKALFGGDNYNTNGFEYYVSGFFVDEGKSEENVGNDIKTATTSRYPSEFDWRNRHGIDWTTSIKDQSTGGGCWAFAAVGAVEILTNLYFNRKLDLDLSEQDVISCNGTSSNNASGGLSSHALNYISRKGVVNEECFPFANADLPCDQKCSTPLERLKIGGYTEIPIVTEDILKENIIFKGPLTSGFHTQWNHAMVLVGFGIIKEGDFIFKDTENWEGAGWVNTIQAGNLLIGKTYWIFKNSYGIGSSPHNVPGTGYIYMVFKDLEHMASNYSISLPITSLNYTEADRICEDRDGDGYYFWGIGARPTSLPSWVPNEPDGDDSNANLGPMDSYGNLKDLNPGLLSPKIINTLTVWGSDNYIHSHLMIQNGGQLIVSGNISMYKDANIVVASGGTLIIDGGKITRANVIVRSGGRLIIKNGGILQKEKPDEFISEVGAILDISYGSIQ